MAAHCADRYSCRRLRQQDFVEVGNLDPGFAAEQFTAARGTFRELNLAHIFVNRIAPRSPLVEGTSTNSRSNLHREARGGPEAERAHAPHPRTARCCPRYRHPGARP